MRLRAITRRAGIAALATGLAAAGTLALSAAPASAAPASVATDDVTVTLRLTMSKEGLRLPGASVIWRTPTSWPFVGGRMCNYMTVGQTKDFQVTVPKGTWFSIGYSNGCPTYTQQGRINNALADHDGQLVEVNLGAGE